MTEYHITLSDTERALIEQQAWNYYRTFGTKMRVPPTLAFDLQLSGVDMKHIEPDPTLEHVTPHTPGGL